MNVTSRIEPELGGPANGSKVIKKWAATFALTAALVSIHFIAAANAALIVFEAESGVLGADWAVSNGPPEFITIASSQAAEAPGIAARVATYSVMFPSAGTYNLYGRVRAGAGTHGNSSFFYGNGFGVKSPTEPADWIRCEDLVNGGFTNPASIVTGAGAAGLSNVWKWINFSEYTGPTGETPVVFVVTEGSQTQTIQIGGLGDALHLDKFGFGKVGYSITVSNLDNGTWPSPAKWLISGPSFLQDGDIILSMYGNPGLRYAAETASALITPVSWTPLVTNTADSAGLVMFTSAPIGVQGFYRVRELQIPVSNPTPPLVYSVENTGADCPAPPLPSMVNLPVIQPLPDPFMWSATNPTNWSYPTGRSTNFADWRCRRAEIKAEIEHYEIGPKPAVDLNNIFASFSGTGTTGTLTVRVTNIVSGTPRTLTLSCAVALPAGTGPFPVVIGMNSPSGSIPQTIFSSRNIVRITYSHNQVTVYGAHSNSDPFYQLYPHLNTVNSGQYAAWAWGVSRIIDGLYKLQGQLGAARINLERIAVTGCSYAGKMALFAGALDERIALTIAQEPGGGGAAAWRVSETLGNVEKLGATDRNWFKDSMFDFAGANVSKLPHDHHELCAMVCPRALLVLGNPPYVWLAEESGYVSCRAVLEVYRTFGIEDRFGFNIVGGHNHCVLETTQSNAVVAFVERFLLGNTNVNTRIRYAPDFAAVDYKRWIQWWGTTNPVFPGAADSYTQTFEPECATVGTNWLIVADANASNGKYVTVRPGVQSLSAAPTNSWDWVVIPFTVTNAGNYLIAGRVYCPNADGDSFWIKVNNEAWTMHNGISPTGVWTWYSFGSRTLTAGSHTLYIGYREDDALLDKISISDYPFAPTGMGAPAAILCP